jgi:hypothetical protein
MPSCQENSRSTGITRCAVCDGKFGLIRYYSCLTPLCSRNCVDRLRTHRTGDRNSLLLIWQQSGRRADTGEPSEAMTFQISQRGTEH